METQTTITLTRAEIELLHMALCTYRGQIGTLAEQTARAGLDSTAVDTLWNQLGSLSRRLAEQVCN